MGDAVAAGGDAPVWLLANPAQGRWVSASHAQTPGPFRLSVPGGSVEIAAMSTGIVTWDNGQVSVDGCGAESTVVKGGRLIGGA